MVIKPEPQVFLFLSQILGEKIVDSEGRPLGKIMDLVASMTEPYPYVTDILLLLRSGKGPFFLPWQRITDVDGKFVVPSLMPEDIREPVLREGEVLLKDTLLDKQVVDTNGAKVLRVNDLHLLKARNSLFLMHVDVGFRGLMRRVGLERPLEVFLRWFFDYTLSDKLISWMFVQALSSPDLLRLRVAQNRLARLHPADLADIIEELDIYKRTAVFQSLDTETAAETLEETNPKIQVSLIENLEPAEASDIIEEMSLSEAADLLGDLPKERAEDILREMEEDFAEDVRELLIHPEEKAGGLMTTSFLRFAPEVSAGEAMDFVRREAEDVDLVYYLYVIDDEEHLLGVISLRELLTAPPQTSLSELMHTRVVSVSLNEKKGQIADHFAKYGLLAIPVVDKMNRIRGVIIFKNLLEVVAPQLGK
ncbi:MAG: CBS domain-containing protein [Syntrophales bacterium]|nr:CBS domain-containing protein [Syntrophales bacterium]